MTINYATGEITQLMTQPEAARVTERIRLSLGSMLDLTDKVLGLIGEARAGQAYTAPRLPLGDRLCRG